MKKIAIIGAGRMACIIAENAKEMIVETYCFAWEEGAFAKDVVDHFYPISIFEKEKILFICQKEKIDGVVATTELTIPIASFISCKMNLNGNPLEISNVITDKYRNREKILSVSTVEHISFKEILSLKELENYSIKYPIILKPTNLGGKKGISVCFSNSDLEKAFEYTIKDSKGRCPIMIEEFVEGGKEYSVESLSFHGAHHIVQITEKITSGPPHCVELAHVQPAGLSKSMKEKVELSVSSCLTAIGLINGPCHTEIKIKDHKIFIIEFNARPGGDHIAHPLTFLSTGFNYIKGVIEIALNIFNPNNLTKIKKRYAGVFFVTKETGFLKNVFDTCEKEQWCYKKNYVTDDLKPLLHNDGFNTNYFIYFSDTKKTPFIKLFKDRF